MFEPLPAAPTDLLASLALRHGNALSLAHLVDAGIDELPLPGSGGTLSRWRVLAAVAANDLSLVKLFEGHTDALAILAELGGAPLAASGSRWGTWCAEPPDARVTLEAGQGGNVRLHGTKAWCSGAASVTHAVVSCWNAAGEPCLAAVAMNQPGDYVRRPGFWQGGAGIAACWFGGALGIAHRVRRPGGPKPDAHRLAHLGAIEVALGSAAALLRESAECIDRHPRDNAQQVAMRARLAVERAATDVIHHAGRAVGAGPLCRDPHFARAMADLPVFLRQSHAERDLAALGQLAIDHDEDSEDNTPEEASPWSL